ncbi:hypothetical protein HRbin22_01726 [Candidatus Thermoflexus japonica]|uniref:Uncharacterized protein n=1 Tax=Candidatus Thermoflexus japonica TaxID=2035417 RepID=A0A2H5Y7S3_9CHLR|nr:hypothetical protein HRbin22_01726 [Candidatus Thermoflexus japonica]
MAHMTVAVSEGAFRRSFDLLQRNVVFEKADSTSFGAFTAGYDVKAHLEGGSIDLRGDGTIQVRELDLRWDRLRFTLGLDLPELCVGGGCIDMPWPIPDICLPRVCIFSGDPDISISLDLAAFSAQEVSFTARPMVRYFDASLPLPSPDLCALLRVEPLPTHNQWHIHIDPETIDVDLFDFPDIVGDLIEGALTSAVEALIPGGWVRDLILAIVGSVADLIRAILDIPDEIEEWLSDLFNVSFGLLDSIGTVILDFFSRCNPLYRVDDPLEILPASNGLIPVRIPIRNFNVSVNDVEMVVQADVGA